GPRPPALRSSAEEPGRIEKCELRHFVSEDRVGDELAAEEAENIAVARVATRDPDLVFTRHTPDDRQEVHDQAEKAGPTVIHAERAPDEVGDERLQSALDRRRRRLDGRELLVQR